MNFFQKERKQEAHFDYCQCPLQADSTAHYKMVKELNTHTYSFDMPKPSNKSTIAEACDFKSPTTKSLTNFSNTHYNAKCRNAKDSKQPP